MHSKAVDTTAPRASVQNHCRSGFVDGISVLDTELELQVTCWLVSVPLSDVQRGARRATRAGHDIAGMGLPGHLGYPGP